MSRSAATANVKRSDMPADKFYGQRELAEFCEFAVTEMFAAPPMSRPGIDTPPLSPTLGEAKRRDPPTLVEFIAYALYRTRLPVSITHQALFLLRRLKVRYPSARGTASSPHRLFLSSLMLSSKISMDDTYSNKSWTIVGGNFFPLREINQMERELFAFLDFNVVVDSEELLRYTSGLQSDHRMRSCRGRSLMSSSSSSSLESLDDRKRKRRDTFSTEQQVVADQALRHKRAADAAIALLRPSVHQAAKVRSSHHRRRPTFCDESFSSSSSSSSSPSTPAYRDSSCSSGSSSTATSPEISTPASPHKRSLPSPPPSSDKALSSDVHIEGACDKLRLLCGDAFQP